MHTTVTERLALFPGSFDPFTLGHLDVVRRAATLFSHVEIAVAVNRSKQPLLPAERRCALIRECTGDLANVSVTSFEGLLAEYARDRGAAAVVRGLRQIGDFEYEVRMAQANRRLHDGYETVFLLPSEANASIHASIVREIFAWGGDVSPFVPEPVLAALGALRTGSNP